MTLLTVGHGTLGQDELAALLTAAGVRCLVDVRRHPGSRRHPHTSAEALARWLPEHGIDYGWREALGGRRRGTPDSPHVAVRNASFRAYADHMGTPAWRDDFDQVIDACERCKVAVMCSESVWWRCHRRFIADAAVMLRGVEVRHLMHDGRRDQHRITSGARLVGGRIVYDVRDGQPALFDEAAAAESDGGSPRR